MLIYQSIVEFISVLYHCITLTTTNHHSRDENHMIKQNSSQAGFHTWLTHIKLKKKMQETLI